MRKKIEVSEEKKTKKKCIFGWNYCYVKMRDWKLK